MSTIMGQEMTETTPIDEGTAPSRRRVFSGMQPSGEVQLGNFITIMPWVHSQYDRENFFCVVDLHTLTVQQDPSMLRGWTRSLAGILLAAGIDPERCTLFVQSHVSAHAECCWLFNCVTPLGWLNKMTQYKDKAAKQESVLAGLLDYPVLQAADILLYDAHEVPIGEDQKQHVELARNVGERFNFLYGETFVIPEPILTKVGARIMGLDDPTKKMSKSSTVRGHAVRVLDDPREIEWAFKRAVTDSGNEISFSEDPERAGVNNLLTIYQAVTGKGKEQVEADFRDARGYGDLKKRVAEVVIEKLRPVQERYRQIMDDAGELERILAIGARRAREVADPKLDLVKERMGLTLPV